MSEKPYPPFAAGPGVFAFIAPPANQDRLASRVISEPHTAVFDCCDHDALFVADALREFALLNRPQNLYAVHLELPMAVADETEIFAVASDMFAALAPRVTLCMTNEAFLLLGEASDHYTGIPFDSRNVFREEGDSLEAAMTGEETPRDLVLRLARAACAKEINLAVSLSHAVIDYPGAPERFTTAAAMCIAVAEKGREAGLHEENTSVLYARLALEHRLREIAGEYALGIRALFRMREIAEEKAGPGSAAEAYVMFMTAMAYLGHNQPGSALENFLQSRASLDALSGSTGFMSASIAKQCADLFMSMREFAHAERMQETAFEGLAGSGTLDLRAGVALDAANCCFEQGEPGRALEWADKGIALAASKALAAELLIARGRARFMIGNPLFAVRDAEAAVQSAADSRDAAVRHSINTDAAFLFLEAGRSDRAIKLIEEAVTLAVRAYGRKSAGTAETLLAAADVHRSAGGPKDQKAASYAKDAAKAFMAAYPKDDMTMAFMLSQIADDLVAAGELAFAVECMEAMALPFEKQYGAKSDYLGKLWEMIEYYSQRCGDTKKAAKARAKALLSRP